MDLSELIESIDIVEFISQFVELEQRGDEYWGLSPFKEENTPSFSVRRETGKFFDFSSGLGGSLMCFVKNYFHCGGREAVEILKKYANVSDDVIPARRKMAATAVCKKYQQPKRKECDHKTRVLSPDYMERFEKRADKLAAWENEGISKSSLDKFQVYYDGFSDRIVFPITDIDGNILNVGGRTLDPLWKEKRQRKYSYFFKWGGGMDVIYGLSNNLQAIKDSKEIILFEGCKSVLLTDTWGIENTGAILTSHLSQLQAKILAGLGCRVVFALDKEIDIKADRNIGILKRYVSVEYLLDADNLLGPKDAPVDKGEDVFRQLYNSRKKL